jgi:hypothetical protein
LQSLTTTAGAMVLSAAFLAFRPILPPPSEAALMPPTHVAREDAAGGRETEPCPRKIGEGRVETVADDARPKCPDPKLPPTAVVTAPVLARSSM